MNDDDVESGFYKDNLSLERNVQH
uniref:Uncharacterized protein n=1 Tax=Steinernema glaseri TaxID=37863 RepID=A0A1I8AMG4_9BILA